MMGQLSSVQERLFYSFNIEDHIPANHLLRSIDRCFDLNDLRHYLADFYSPIGRPSIDPELMIRLLVVGYCYGIRSEHWLCEEAHLNLAYRWFCRLSLEDEVPNNSTFSKNRHGRFRDSSLFRWLFNEVLRRCMGAGLVTGHALRGEWRAFKNQRSHVTKADTIIFRSRQTDCSKCSMKECCCPNASFRKIARSVHEAARNVAR